MKVGVNKINVCKQQQIQYVSSIVEPKGNIILVFHSPDQKHLSFKEKYRFQSDLLISPQSRISGNYRKFKNIRKNYPKSLGISRNLKELHKIVLI